MGEIPLRIPETLAYEARSKEKSPANDSVWTRSLKLLVTIIIALIAVVSYAVATVAIVPQFESTAYIRVEFTGDSLLSDDQSRSSPALDPNSIVDSAVRLIRSRALANSVVALFGLDKDPKLARMSLSSEIERVVRGLLKAPNELQNPSEADLAASELMRRLTVANEAKSYLISVSVRADSPHRAAELTNYVALTFLREEYRRQAVNSERRAEAAAAKLLLTYGPRHPKAIELEHEILQLKTRLETWRDSTAETIRLSTGYALVPAEEVQTPSNPELRFVIGLISGLSIVFIWLTWRWPRSRRSQIRNLADEC